MLFDAFLQRATASVTGSRTPTPCDAVLRCPQVSFMMDSLRVLSGPFWSSVIFWSSTFLCTGSRNRQRHHQICPEHHQHRNKQCHRQSRILPSEPEIPHRFLINIFFSQSLFKMVFAERGETISGGNFHGEYPAKVCVAVILTTF